MKNKTQRCRHPYFYTMGNDKVYCNSCHKYLGFFSPWRQPFGFHKKTKDTIEDEYLNEETVSRLTEKI